MRTNPNARTIKVKKADLITPLEKTEKIASNEAIVAKVKELIKTIHNDQELGREIRKILSVR